MANGSSDSVGDDEIVGLSDTVSPIGEAKPDAATSPELPERSASIDESLADILPAGHIFVSYKKEDRERVRPLAEALERRGWPVWWDRDIRVGESFRKVIAQALEDAACVVVMWTELSVRSEWVQEEAQWARVRNILVPAILDENVHQPLGFGQVQAADIAAWSGEADDPLLGDLLTGVAKHLGFDHIPPLLDSKEWDAIQNATSPSLGRAEARQIERVEAADSAAHLAERERKAASAAEAEAAVMAADGAVDEAATNEAAALAAEQRELADEAERSAADAETHAALAAAELAAERAVALRAAAAKTAEREARALAAEEAAARAEDERLAQASADEREQAANEIEREAAVREAEERAQAALEAAERAAASRAAAARDDRASTTPPPGEQPTPAPHKQRRWPIVLGLLFVVVAGGVVAAIVWPDDTVPPDVTVAQAGPTIDQPDETPPSDQPEPSIDVREVQFASGASGATLSGNVTSDQHIQYQLRASEGQRMIVHALSTSGFAQFDIQTVDGTFIERGSDVFLGDLPVSDVYRISVSPEGDAAGYDLFIDITSDCSTFNLSDSLPLGLCDEGGLVEDVQTALVARGSALSIDGEFGRNTQLAVAEFQYGSGLPATGRVDETTLDALT